MRIITLVIQVVIMFMDYIGQVEIMEMKLVHYDQISTNKVKMEERGK